MMAFKVNKKGNIIPGSRGSFNTFNSLRTKGDGLTQEHYELHKNNIKDLHKLDATKPNQSDFMKTKKLKPKQYISFN